MNTEEDEFKRIEAEAKRRAQDDDDDTQGYVSESKDPRVRDAADELRRLHLVNQELLAALKAITSMETEYANATVKRMGTVARAAIAKAERTTT